MIRPPTCYLQLSFFVHGAGLVLLLVGYGTPCWTRLWTSAGKVNSLGLVVTCSQKGCQLLHITQARDDTVVVFCLLTATVLLVLFTSQLFCLSVCNNSCRARNMGIGLSYLSFLAALMAAVTQVLYQTDLRREDKPDVTSMTVGWSRYLVIVSSVTFCVSASLSVADYLTRNSSQRTGGVANKCAVSVIHDGNSEAEDEMVHGNMARAAHGSCIRGKKMSQVADMATSVPHDHAILVNEIKNSCNNKQTKTNVVVVSQTPRDRKIYKIDNGRFHGPTTKAHTRAGLAIVANALQRYTSTKVGNTDGVGMNQCLPIRVEEGKVSYDVGRTAQKRKILTRQMALADDTSDTWHTSLPDKNSDTWHTSLADNNSDTWQTSLADNKNINCVPDRMCTVAPHCEPIRRLVKSTELRDLTFSQKSKCHGSDVKEKSFINKNARTKTTESQGNGRKNSVVEDALLSFNRLMGTSVSYGYTSEEKTLKGQSLQTGIEDSYCPLDDQPDSFPVGKCRTFTNEKPIPCGREYSTVEKEARKPHKSGTIELPSKVEHSIRMSERESKAPDMQSASDNRRISSKWKAFQEQFYEGGEMRNKLISESLSRDLERRKVHITQ